MIAAGVFDLPSRLLAWFYSLTHSYAAAIALMAVVVMVITAPLTLKSTKGMLEMQRLAPEMRKLQAQYRNDRTKLNEEMMKLYQEHKVNPLSSCLPLLAQMPVFIIMFRILYGLDVPPAWRHRGAGSGDLLGGRTARPRGRLPPPLHLPRQRAVPVVGRPDRDGVARTGLGEVAVRRARRQLRHGADLPRTRGRPRRALPRAAADGGGSCRRQPDDVASPAEADAVPARRLRRVPGVLRARPGHLLHRPGDPADRAAALHHPGVLRSRRGPRTPGPARQRARSRARQAGHRRIWRRGWIVRPGAPRSRRDEGGARRPRQREWRRLPQPPPRPRPPPAHRGRRNERPSRRTARRRRARDNPNGAAADPAVHGPRALASASAEKELSWSGSR